MASSTSVAPSLSRRAGSGAKTSSTSEPVAQAFPRTFSPAWRTKPSATSARSPRAVSPGRAEIYFAKDKKWLFVNGKPHEFQLESGKTTDLGELRLGP